MKVLQVITSLRSGGAEALAVNLAAGLRKAGIETDILVFDGTPSPLFEKAAANGIPVHSLGNGDSYMRSPKMALRLRTFLKQHQYDIIHTHNSACQFYAALLRPSCRLKLVTTEHNFTNRRRGLGLLSRAVDRWMYGRYKSIICVGEKTREGLIEWLSKESLTRRIKMIPNGIHLEVFRDAVPTSLLKGKVKVLMVAAFRPQKDQISAIKALQKLPEDICLNFAGGAETKADNLYYQRCKDLVQTLELSERVNFLGIMDNIPGLMSEADILLLSTHYEGMPISLLEAMATGKPVIASDVSGVSEIAGGAAILVPEEDAEALACAIMKITEDSTIADSAGKRCKSRSAAYDIKNTIERHISLYKEA